MTTNPLNELLGLNHHAPAPKSRFTKKGPGRESCRTDRPSRRANQRKLASTKQHRGTFSSN